mmetsp:Transcript_23571/g.49062  ORF Transcript_23571/g.49062 Transcript_23571/m.49062 type:complete len:242 (-) Transcript_23571:879-1604(-)
MLTATDAVQRITSSTKAQCNGWLRSWPSCMSASPSLAQLTALGSPLYKVGHPMSSVNCGNIFSSSIPAMITTAMPSSAGSSACQTRKSADSPSAASWRNSRTYTKEEESRSRVCTSATASCRLSWTCDSNWKSTRKAVLMPSVCRVPHNLHLSHPTHFMISAKWSKRPCTWSQRASPPGPAKSSSSANVLGQAAAIRWTSGKISVSHSCKPAANSGSSLGTAAETAGPALTTARNNMAKAA